MATTLKQLRTERNMTLNQVLEKLQHAIPNAPRHHTGLIHIENRGTDRLPVIRALAEIYDVPLATVEEAANASRQNNFAKLAH